MTEIAAADKPIDEILYDEIDADIRPLVELFNDQNDFCTSESCAGHEEGGPTGTFVTLGVRGYDGVIALAKALTALENTHVDMLTNAEFLWFTQLENGEDSTPGWLWFDVRFHHEDEDEVLMIKDHRNIVNILAEHFRTT